jgi:DNA-3-methyladenine glycosylase I
MQPAGFRGLFLWRCETEVLSYLPMPKERCPWATDELYCEYHDREWGVPRHDDIGLFEMLILEGAQAGLSWITILRKRESYRAAFDGFVPEKIARYGERDVEKLLQNPGIVRNRLKVAAAIQNAKSYLKVRDEYSTFDRYIWQFVEGNPIQNHWRNMREVPAKTPISDAMSKDLLGRGFKFVGSTICYAYMQAVGMVNDHLVSCYRQRELQVNAGEARPRAKRGGAV